MLFSSMKIALKRTYQVSIVFVCSRTLTGNRPPKAPSGLGVTKFEI